MSLLRRGDPGSVEEEREALRRQRAEGAAELERLKQVLAERVEFVRMRERQLEDALAQAGKDAPDGDRRSRFRLPEGRRDDPAIAHERQVLEARTADLVRRETALAEREQVLAERERQLAEAQPAVSDEEFNAREAALAEREQELGRREAELHAQDPAEQEARIASRLGELEAAELQFVKTHAELAARSERLAEREQELAARERALPAGNGTDTHDRISPVDIEAIEARLRRLEQSGGGGRSFSEGLRALEQRGLRPRGETDSPLH
jgi:chromosome segregation ATPase